MGTWRAPGDSPLLQLLFSVLPEGEREKLVKSLASFRTPHEKKSPAFVFDITNEYRRLFQGVFTDYLTSETFQKLAQTLFS